MSFFLPPFKTPALPLPLLMLNEVSNLLLLIVVVLPMGVAELVVRIKEVVVGVVDRLTVCFVGLMGTMPVLVRNCHLMLDRFLLNQPILHNLFRHNVM